MTQTNNPHIVTDPDGKQWQVQGSKIVPLIEDDKDQDLFIYFVIDRSGSMAGHESDTIGGINAMLDEQQREGEKLGSKTRVSMCLFDHEHLLPVKDQPIADVKRLDASSYVPRGQTALLDAIGRSIRDCEATFGLPKRVMFVIVTDGHENNSRDWNYDSIKDLITKKTEKDQWVFTYLQAELGAVYAGATAQAMGISPGNTASYSHHHTHHAYHAATQSASAVRTTPVEDFNVVLDSAFGGTPDSVKDIDAEEEKKTPV